MVTGLPCSGVVCGPFAYTGGTLFLTASGGEFEYKTNNGATGLGVGTEGNAEIEIEEFVTGAFSGPVTLDAFRLLFFYNGPEYGDPFEIAQISINGGSLIGTLTAGAVDNTAFSSLGGATVVNCGVTTITGTGCFDVLNPFGSALVSSVAFTALHSPGGEGNDSDYSLSSLQVRDAAVVPEPATLILVGTGVAAAVRARRRKP